MALLFRWIGAVLVALCGGSIGLYRCHCSTLRRKTLQQIHLLLQLLQTEIRYRKADLPALYRQLQTNEQFCLLALPPNGEFCALPTPICLTKEEAASFSDCFSGLGMAGTAQECQRLDYFLQRFSDFASKAMDEETQSRQLYPRLGFGAGIMAAISLL